MTVLDELRRASSAEDFFRVLHVDYDAKVLNVARLHVLRKMGEFLATEPLDQLDDDVVRERCRTLLRTAHDAFLEKSPLETRLFKVHKNAAPAPEKAAFVPLSVLSTPRTP